MHINSPKTGTGDVIISVQALNPLPVVDPDKQTEQLINNLIDTILHKMENGEDTVKEEENIDLMVYKLYHLTYEEARIVDPKFLLLGMSMKKLILSPIFTSMSSRLLKIA